MICPDEMIAQKEDHLERISRVAVSSFRNAVLRNYFEKEAREYAYFVFRDILLGVNLYGNLYTNRITDLWNTINDNEVVLPVFRDAVVRFSVTVNGQLQHQDRASFLSTSLADAFTNSLNGPGDTMYNLDSSSVSALIDNTPWLLFVMVLSYSQEFYNLQF